jgi:hypothetical protein
MSEPEMIMRPYWHLLRSFATLGAIGLWLPGCETVLTPLVGQSKEAKAHDAAVAVAPPGPRPSAAFVNDSILFPGYAGSSILPPTLPVSGDTDDISDDIPAAGAGPHKVLAAVPITSDPKALGALSEAANQEAGITDAHFVLLVLTPPATDAATLDRNTTAARLAATTAIKVLGDGGIPPDHVQVSMATSPAAGTGELRLYRR